MAAHQLPKLRVAGSSPVYRSSSEEGAEAICLDNPTPTVKDSRWKREGYESAANQQQERAQLAPLHKTKRNAEV